MSFFSLQDDSRFWQCISNGNATIEKQWFCTRKGKGFFCVCVLLSVTIHARFSQVTVFLCQPFLFLPYDNENQKIKKYIPGSQPHWFISSRNGPDSYITQQTTCGFQRQWIIPSRLRWKHMLCSHPFYCHFKICMTILFAQYSKHTSTYRSQTQILYEKTFKTDSARAEPELQSWFSATGSQKSL